MYCIFHGYVIPIPCNILPGLFAQGGPKILGGSITIRMLLEVPSHTLQKDLLAKVSGKHPDSRRALKVTDVIKDLINLQGILHPDVRIFYLSHWTIQ